MKQLIQASKIPLELFKNNPNHTVNELTPIIHRSNRVGSERSQNHLHRGIGEDRLRRDRKWHDEQTPRE